MTRFDPHTALDLLFAEYDRRADAIRRDLALQRSPDFAEQASERQNDDVLHALLAEAEEGLRQVGLACQRLAEGRYGLCAGCGEAIAPARLQALPAAEFCLGCVGQGAS
ncbi:TraR/DksA family transcriptional regulator [Pseudomonas paralcaligenes]|uniref:TraR/DksA family transcriptional regulator n=1 Tax=Pseudomonas paralcaligenes TaxID=2772558 RepID=UPI001C816ADB|nr:TraR/DksA C4-type zinc finger protein [Pseudomonas paralcaligenes]